MRAVYRWLALAPFLLFAGCRTTPSVVPPAPDSSLALSGAEDRFADALAHYSQALISENTLGEFQNGLFHYRQAASSDPASLPLNIKVALDYLTRKDYTGAVQVLESTRRLHPRSPEASLLLAAARQGLGQTDEAIRLYRQTIRHAPDRPDAYVRLASLYVVRLTPRKTLDVVEEGVAKLKDPGPLMELCGTVGRIYLAGKDTSAAIRMFEPVFRHGTGYDDTCELLGQCYAALGRNREARTVFETLLQRKPDSSLYAMLLGEVFEQMGELEPAMAAYERAVAGQPPEAMATLRLSNIQMEKCPAKGLATLEAAVKTFPDDFRVHVFLALSYMRIDRFEDAVQQFDWISRALAANGGELKGLQPLFYYWYGQACDRAGRAAEAERYIGKYLQSNPNSAEAMNYLAYMWAEQGRSLDQALIHIRKALKAEPDNGAFLDTLGWILFKQGKAAEAVAPLKRALKKEGESATILEHLGDALHAAGRDREAVPYWTRALRRDPASAALRAKLLQAGVREQALPALPVALPRPAGPSGSK